MIVKGLIIVILVMVAGMCKGLCDKISFHHSESIFATWSNFWNPVESWKFKYKEDLITERFPFSTTALVLFTDAWHLFQAVQFWALSFAIGISATLSIDFSKLSFFAFVVFSRLVHQLGFYLMYNKFLVSNSNKKT